MWLLLRPQTGTLQSPYYRRMNAISKFGIKKTAGRIEFVRPVEA